MLLNCFILFVSHPIKLNTELRMKNHCGESVGFSFRATLWFPPGFCLCEVSETNVMLSFDLLAIFTVKWIDYILLAFLSCLLVFFFICYWPNSFFSIKGNCCVFELSVLCEYSFHCMIATKFELQLVQSTATLKV